MLSWGLCWETVSSKIIPVAIGTNYTMKPLILPIHLNSGKCVLPSAQSWPHFCTSFSCQPNRSNTLEILPCWLHLFISMPLIPGHWGETLRKERRPSHLPKVCSLLMKMKKRWASTQCQAVIPSLKETKLKDLWRISPKAAAHMLAAPCCQKETLHTGDSTRHTGAVKFCVFEGSRNKNFIFILKFASDFPGIWFLE